MKDKLALFCNVDEDCIIENLDADSLYELPLMLRDEGLGRIVCRKLAMEEKPMELSDWMEIAGKRTQSQARGYHRSGWEICGIA